MIEDLRGGADMSASFSVNRVNTWSVMRGIINQSRQSVMWTVVAIVVTFGLDLLLHHHVFHDTPCGNRTVCDFDGDGLTAEAEPGGVLQATWVGITLEGWREIGAFMPEVVFAVVGIALSIVSLILQLSATRYSPFVVELFFRDPVSSFVLNYFVASAIYCLWINCLLGNVALNFMPRISATPAGTVTS